jgi:carbonic anhydrase
MSATTILEQMRAANAKYRAGHPEPIESPGTPFIVLACIDPRLTGFLEPALGLPRTRAIVVRTAGNQAGPANHDVIRSIAAAIFLRQAGEVFVIGHTDCAMASFSSAQVIEAFRNAGVARTAFGEGDLREWFGAFSDVKGNVTSSVEYLRKCACIPRTVKVHGLILSLEDASLEVVVNGDLAPVTAPAPAATPEKETPAPAPVKAESEERRHDEAPPPVPPVPPSLLPKARPVVIPETKAMPGRRAEKIPAPQTMMDAVIALREILVAERRDPQVKRQLAEFSSLVRRERNPARILAALETIISDAEGRYPQLPGILAFLRASVEAPGAGSKFSEFMRRIAE